MNPFGGDAGNQDAGTRVASSPVTVPGTGGSLEGVGGQIYAELLAEREARRNERRLQRKAAKSSPKPEPTFRGLGCRGKSSRKKNRLFNGTTSQLLPLVLLFPVTDAILA